MNLKTRRVVYYIMASLEPPSLAYLDNLRSAYIKEWNDDRMRDMNLRRHTHQLKSRWIGNGSSVSEMPYMVESECIRLKDVKDPTGDRNQYDLTNLSLDLIFGMYVHGYVDETIDFGLYDSDVLVEYLTVSRGVYAPLYNPSDNIAMLFNESDFHNYHIRLCPAVHNMETHIYFLGATLHDDIYRDLYQHFKNESNQNKIHPFLSF